MPRKSTAAELQAEEAAVNSPLRRSSRIVSGTGTIPAGVTTRRTSQTLEPQTNTPARATRGRRASAQDSEEKVESQPAKPATRTRRASILAEEESQKETSSTPSKRTRKPSVTTEPLEEEPEVPKPVRARRGSTASTTDEPEEKKPSKTAPVRSRRSSANVEPQVEVNVAPLTPSRVTTRRRSSATDNVVVEEVTTPAKRSTRGRRTSNTEEIGDITEVKKPASRGRRTSVNEEEDIRTEELVKPAGRRGRKTSTDDPSANTAPKTPGRMGRRPSITKDVDIEDLTTEKDKVSFETQQSKDTTDGTTSEEKMSPIVLRDVSVRVTPLKKRKFLEKMEAELDLSVINESSDDIDNSKHDESCKEKTDDNGKVSQSVSFQTTALKDGEAITPIDNSSNSGDETNIEPLNVSGKVLNTSTRSLQDTSSSKKRISAGNDDMPSPRKSPRLTEKLSRSSTSNEELEAKKLPTPKKPRNLMKENNEEVNVTEKSQASFLSSGSDGSFKFHLSNVSVAISGQQDSNKENTEDDILNTSKESTGSNKENIEQIESLSDSKASLNGSVKIPVQEPIIVSRVSNVFKPNQKDFSFMEPMEIDEDSVYSETPAEKSGSLKINNLDQKIAEILPNVPSAENSLNSEESSVEFNYNAPLKKLNYDQLPLGLNSSEETKSVPTPKFEKYNIQQNLLETEGSDSNVLIEETQDTVNFSIQQTAKKTELQPATSSQRRSRSPKANDVSLIINQPLEQVKVVLLGKSSSPIINRRKSKSPVPRAVSSTDTEQGIRRRSKSKSKSPCIRSDTKSPTFKIGNTVFTEIEAKARLSPQDSDILVVPRRSKSKSKSPSPRRSSIRSPSFLCVDADQEQMASRISKSPVCVDEVELRATTSSAARKSSSNDSIRSTSLSPRPRRSYTKSPSCLCVHVDDKVKTRKSKSDRSKSNSPSPKLQDTPVAQDSKKSRRSVRSKSKSPIPDTQKLLENKNIITAESINQVDEETKSRKSIRSMTKSPLQHSKDNTVAQDKLRLSSTRSKSKSPVVEVLLDQSFEKPKGTEEFIVVNEKVCVDRFPAANKIDPSLKHLSEDITTNVCLSTENQCEDINNTASEQTNIQDKTEYHTAIATTNNESGFTSVLNTNIEVSQSNIKDSESTHYDFDLDSDEDELFVSKEGKSVGGMDSNTPDQRTRQFRRELVIELKKSFGKTNITEDKYEKNESLVDIEGAKEKSRIGFLASGNSGELSQDGQADKEEENNDSCIQEEQEFVLATTKQMALERKPLEVEDKMEEQSNEAMVTSTSAQDDDDTTNDSHLTADRSRTSLSKLSVDDSSNKNGEVDMKEISEQNNKKEMLKDHNQHDNTNKKCPKDESHREVEVQEGCVDLSVILDKINKSEKKKRESNRDANEKNLLNISDVVVKEMSGNEDDIGLEKESPNEHNESKTKCDSRKSKEKNLNKKLKDQQDSKTNESIQEVTSCKMKAQKVEKLQSDNPSSTDKKSQIKEDSKSSRTKVSLDEFASSKLDEYLNSKADELESSSEGEEEESEAEYNEFIDGMAEEGEEDTPSEDSNQIIDEGESIGFSSDQDLSDDDYDENDSFICDEEDLELLSGEEYDLDMKKNKKKKKSRIIDISAHGDDDIIKIPKKNKEQNEEPKRRSRIIVVSDSSDEDPSESGFEIKDQSIKKGDNSVKEGEDNANKEENVQGSVILIEESTQIDDSNAEENEESKTTDTNRPIVIEESKYENISDAIIIEDSKVVDSSQEMVIDKSNTKDINHSVITEECDSQSISHNMSVGNINASIQKRNRKSSLSIQENIMIDGVKDPLISQRINTLVESFCATVKQGEISLNLSLEYEGAPEEKDKKPTINVLSDVKIYMGKPKVSQASEEKEEDVIIDTDKLIVLHGEEENKEDIADLEENYEHEESQPNVSLIKPGDLREVLNKRNLKRKLSKNLDEMQEEVQEVKRRKTHTTDKGNKKIAKIKKNKMHTNLRKDVLSTFSSFSIMNQLITDVKNRPRRTIKPTTADAEVESSWATSKITNLKPSTSPVTKQEKINIKQKLHPKDFKNQMLSNDTRVKRIDTKTLLKKKGAY